MGNCLKLIASDDNCSDKMPQRCGNATERLRLLSDHHDHCGNATERLRLLSDHHDHDQIMRSYDDSGGIMVKIRISKKELEQMVGVKGLSTEQLLAHLIINGHDRSDHAPHLEHQRSWRPALQSIPEVD